MRRRRRRYRRGCVLMSAKTKWIGAGCVLICGVAAIAAVTWGFAMPGLGSHEPEVLAAAGQVALLGIAAIVAALYAFITWAVANEAFEARKLAARPYVRLKQVVKPKRQDKPDEPDKPDVHVYAYNEGPHVAWDVVVKWTGDAGRQATAGELVLHEESERWAPPCRCERAVLTYESMMGQKCKRRYDKTPSGWWRPELRRSHGS